MAAGGDVITQSGVCFIYLTSGDKITIRTMDDSGGGTGNYYGGNLNLVRVGDNDV